VHISTFEQWRYGSNSALKLWRVRNGLRIRHFALELLTIKLLKDKKSLTLANQLKHVWEELRDHPDNLSIEDPANPTGNDLSALLDASIKSELSGVARATLNAIANSGWQAVFGPIDDMSEKEKTDSLKNAATRAVMPTCPGCLRYEPPWHKADPVCSRIQGGSAGALPKPALLSPKRPRCRSGQPSRY
jgi:hypothetical protein